MPARRVAPDRNDNEKGQTDTRNKQRLASARPRHRRVEPSSLADFSNHPMLSISGEEQRRFMLWIPLSGERSNMDKDSIITTYRRYARHYDAIFGRVFDPGRRVVVERMNPQPGERILEVGVGTGISLPYYPPSTQVTGIDLSPHMLERAEQRVHEHDLTNASLEVMDAEHMSFPDGFFNKVVAMYVASVVPNPPDMVAEMKRVCKPGGDLYIMNHFSNSSRLVNTVEKLLSPLAKIIGFRPAFPMEQFIAASALDVVEILPVNAFGYWTLIHARNS